MGRGVATVIQIGPRELQGVLPIGSPAEEPPRSRSADRDVSDYADRSRSRAARGPSLAELVRSEVWGWQAGMLAQCPDGGFVYVTEAMVDRGVPEYLTPAIGDPETLRRLLFQVGRRSALRDPGDAGPVRW